jgi:hypothetical protein
MGNCQAADAAAVVIQHPGDGKVERLHWPATAADVMRRNPGHYVAHVVLHHVPGGVDPDPAVAGESGGARITKIKLLKPRDTLLLGQVYRLITSQGSCLISSTYYYYPDESANQGRFLDWIPFASCPVPSVTYMEIDRPIRGACVQR